MLVLAALTYLLHGSALRGGWRVDDPWILLYVLENPDPWGYFFSPAQWQGLWTAFFTPWLALDFWIDANVFGLDPPSFYLHHLIVVWLVAVLTFVLLGRTVGQLWGGIAAALFLAGSPVTVISQQLMSRHYATGLVFTILAISFWLWRREHPKWHLLVLAVVCYVAAVLNKEIYASLPLVLFFLGSDSVKARVRDILPFVLTAFLFVVWRAGMLGTIVGGYHGDLNAAGDLLRSLGALPQVFFGLPLFAPVAGLLLLLAAVVVGRDSRRRLLVVISAVGALTLPFFALRVSTNISHFRLALLPWWAVCVLLVVAGARVSEGGPIGQPHGRWRWLYLLCLLPLLALSMLAFWNGRESSRRYSDIAAAYDVQGRFLLAHDEGVAYVPGAGVAADLQFQFALSEISWGVIGKRPPRAVPTLESAAWFAGAVPVYRYDSAGRCMDEVNPETLRNSPHSGYRPVLPLTVRMDRFHRGMEWAVHSSAGASCALVFPSLNAVFSIPCIGKVRFDLPPFVRGDFRVFVNTPGNQWNVSPMFSFPGKGDTLEWEAGPTESRGNGGFIG